MDGSAFLSSPAYLYCTQFYIHKVCNHILSETMYSMLTDCGREREVRLGWQEKFHVCWFDGVADVAFSSFWMNFYFSFEMSRDEMAM